MPVLRVRARRTRGLQFLEDAFIYPATSAADLVVAGRRTSGAGVRPKRRRARRAAFLDESALHSAGFVVDDEPGHLVVCVPAGPVPCALMVAGFHPHTHGAGAPNLVHRLRSDGRAVRRRAPHQVTGGLLDPVREDT